MDKRGISSIISEVLMVAATVVMCALVILWAVTYVKGMQATAESTISSTSECILANLQVKSACLDAGNNVIELVVDNIGGRVIDGVNIRVLGASGGYNNITSQKFGIGDVKRIEIPYQDSIGRFSYIELLPIRELHGKKTICMANIRYSNMQPC